MNEQTRAATAEILAYNPKALQFLHHAAGFNFDKSFECYKHTGPFTAKKLLDAHELNAETANKQLKIALLILPATTPRRNGERPQKLIYSAFDGYEFEARRADGVSYWDYQIDYLFAKSDINNVRKGKAISGFEGAGLSDVISYVFFQRVPLLEPRQPRNVDLSARLICEPYEYMTGDACGRSWIGAFYAKEIGRNEKRIKCNVYSCGVCGGYSDINFYVKDRITDINNIYDKSGYILLGRRAELKRRAEQLREERAKAAFIAVDYSKEIDAISAQIKFVKSLLSGFILSSFTSEELEKAEKAANALWWAVWYFEKDVQRFNDKTYRSTEQAQSAINEMRERVQKIAAIMGTEV